MQFEWDENKRLNNIEKHGVDFVVAFQLWEAPMLVVEDIRRDYDEQRWIALGKLNHRVMVVAYTKRKIDIVRIISFRKANKREVAYYEKIIKQNEKIY